MIVPMKKVTLVVMDRERETALERLREVGVVHLAKKQVSSPVLEKLMEERSRFVAADALLRTAAAEAEKKGIAPAAEPCNDPVGETLRLHEEIKTLQEANAADLREISRLEAWGDVSSKDFAELASGGVELVPYELPRRDYERLGDDDKVLVISASKTSVNVLSVGAPLGDTAKLEGKTPFALGERSLSEIRRDLDNRRTMIAELEPRLLELTFERQTITKALSILDANIEFETARVGMPTLEDLPEGASPELGIAWLTGFVPDSDAGLVKRAALENSWALIIDDVKEEDSVPTKLDNRLFGRMAKPVFGLLGTVPGYREYDISISFLAFFTLFFAMIFGDAGYGSVMFLGILLFGLKKRPKTKEGKEGFLLLAMLSFATVVWGAVNGNWFGIDSTALPGILQAVILPSFRVDPGLDIQAANKLIQQNVKHLCFIIGVVQLALAHLKNIKKLFPSLVMFSQIGWLSMVIGLYFLVLNLVLDREAFPVPAFALWMIGGGLGLYFLFVEQKGGNFLVNIGKGFANFLPTFLSAVSSFSDIISYIRLFAVSLAGLSIAQSFNGMAQAMPEGLVRILAGGLILLFGHGLNLAMNALSVMVHGIRLNMLEYSGHLGMEWSGTAYRPFAQRNAERTAS